MSAQQLNSNVELQTMLKSISDPGQPIQAALRIIDDIDNAYVKGAGMPKKNAPKAGNTARGPHRADDEQFDRSPWTERSGRSEFK
jgi:hypothetical protein